MSLPLPMPSVFLLGRHFADPNSCFSQPQLKSFSPQTHLPIVEQQTELKRENLFFLYLKMVFYGLTLSKVNPHIDGPKSQQIQSCTPRRRRLRA